MRCEEAVGAAQGEHGGGGSGLGGVPGAYPEIPWHDLLAIEFAEVAAGLMRGGLVDAAIGFVAFRDGHWPPQAWRARRRDGGTVPLRTDHDAAAFGIGEDIVVSDDFDVGGVSAEALAVELVHELRGASDDGD